MFCAGGPNLFYLFLSAFGANFFYLRLLAFQVPILESTRARETLGDLSLLKWGILIAQSWTLFVVQLQDCKKCVALLAYFSQMSTGRYELIGAVSWGRNCAKSFGVYADIPCKISHFYLLVPGNCVIYSATISYYSLYFATYFRLPPVGDRNSGHSLHCLASGSAWK